MAKTAHHSLESRSKISGFSFSSVVTWNSRLKRVFLIGIVLVVGHTTVAAEELLINGQATKYVIQLPSGYMATVGYRQGGGTSSSAYGLETSSERVILKRPDFMNQIRIDKTSFASKADMDRRMRYMKSSLKKSLAISNEQFGSIEVFDLGPEVGTAQYIAYIGNGLTITTIALDLVADRITQSEYDAYISVASSIRENEN